MEADRSQFFVKRMTVSVIRRGSEGERECVFNYYRDAARLLLINNRFGVQMYIPKMVSGFGMVARC